MMASAQVFIYLTCFFLAVTAQMNNLKLPSSVHRERHFISVRPGDSVTLHCFSKADLLPQFYWYKQSLGEKPRLISTFNTLKKDATFHNEFKSDPRFTLETKTGQNHLMIANLRISDSATYYCVYSTSYTTMFSESITVGVEDAGSNINTLVQQSVYGTIQPGGSVTLKCIVHIGTCNGQHSVYWFKDSQESHPGHIYTHGGRNDQCERKLNTKTQTCVYNLTMRSLNVSHAGTYYCAVASCGHILFGEGTKLDTEDEVNSLVLVRVLSGAIAFISVLSLSQVSILCVIINTKKESRTRYSDIFTKDEKDYKNVLEENKIRRSRRMRDGTWSECVYFSVK